ncbi:hypothetical protein M446_1955 [Methylobacterium sp. 4-46]|nr:hypothetical protein M446_1955 [Methylobacterium sp. 4-46]
MGLVFFLVFIGPWLALAVLSALGVAKPKPY